MVFACSFFLVVVVCFFNKVPDQGFCASHGTKAGANWLLCGEEDEEEKKNPTSKSESPPFWVLLTEQTQRTAAFSFPFKRLLLFILRELV